MIEYFENPYFYGLSDLTDVIVKKSNKINLNSQNELERFCLYTNFFINERGINSNHTKEEIKIDLNTIFINKVGLTSSEYLCLENHFFSKKRKDDECASLESEIYCKLNKYLFANLRSIFVSEVGNSLRSFRNINISRSADNETISSNYSDSGMLQKITISSPGSTTIRYYNDCGFIDYTEDFDSNGNVKSREYKLSNTRNWSGKEEYFSDGSLFISERTSNESSYLLTLNHHGDTLNYIDRDYSGSVDDFHNFSFSRNLTLEQTSNNGNGVWHVYGKNRDSIYIASTYESYSDILFSQFISDNLLTLQKARSLDEIFKHQFISNLHQTNNSCINNWVLEIGKQMELDTNLYLPFVRISCEMATEVFDSVQSIKHEASPNKQELIELFDFYNGEIRNEGILKKIYQYNRESNTHNIWKNYAGIIQRIIKQVDTSTLLSLYNSHLNYLMGYSRNQHINANNVYRNDLEKLLSVKDTLGQDFYEFKKHEIMPFLNSLSDSEMNILKEMNSAYEVVLSNFFEEYSNEIWNRSYGLEWAIEEYYYNIINLLIKHPNGRLFQRNMIVPFSNEFESILEKFDLYLAKDRYERILLQEDHFFLSMAGFDRFMHTIYNPYIGVGEIQKRKFRLFNWLINQGE